ncbi:hypothetical protein EGW08_012645 [Elysia chlorotica]|uniref:Uncharacterized protein n=1 Tax=Elysia chlorotica TaxID=188477 RepID=A0A3S0ZK67_ELYCH|nr:hypothetical protein EGW08_012645 [Elysia chlorotica]
MTNSINIHDSSNDNNTLVRDTETSCGSNTKVNFLTLSMSNVDTPPIVTIATTASSADSTYSKPCVRGNSTVITSTQRRHLFSPCTSGEPPHCDIHTPLPLPLPAPHLSTAPGPLPVTLVSAAADSSTPAITMTVAPEDRPPPPASRNAQPLESKEGPAPDSVAHPVGTKRVQSSASLQLPMGAKGLPPASSPNSMGSRGGTPSLSLPNPIEGPPSTSLAHPIGAMFLPGSLPPSFILDWLLHQQSLKAKTQDRGVPSLRRYSHDISSRDFSFPSMMQQSFSIACGLGSNVSVGAPATPASVTPRRFSHGTPSMTQSFPVDSTASVGDIVQQQKFPFPSSMCPPGFMPPMSFTAMGPPSGSVVQHNFSGVVAPSGLLRSCSVPRGMDGLTTVTGDCGLSMDDSVPSPSLYPPLPLGGGGGDIPNYKQLAAGSPGAEDMPGFQRLAGISEAENMPYFHSQLARIPGAEDVSGFQPHLVGLPEAGDLFFFTGFQCVESLA